jgi:hypothetical protein
MFKGGLSSDLNNLNDLNTGGKHGSKGSRRLKTSDLLPLAEVPLFDQRQRDAAGAQ